MNIILSQIGQGFSDGHDQVAKILIDEIFFNEHIPIGRAGGGNRNSKGDEDACNNECEHMPSIDISTILIIIDNVKDRIELEIVFIFLLQHCVIAVGCLILKIFVLFLIVIVLYLVVSIFKITVEHVVNLLIFVLHTLTNFLVWLFRCHSLLID